MGEQKQLRDLPDYVDPEKKYEDCHGPEMG
jgi:hypothetical protein